MPALLLGVRDSSRFEVVGSYSTAAPIVSHVALLSASTSLTANGSVDVFDMATKALRLGTPNPVRCHAVGWLPLSKDEEEQLDAWLADMRTLVGACTYFALPAADPKIDPTTNRVVGWRFSCAGFVSQAYRNGAGVDLVVTESILPELPFERLHAIWLGGRPEDVARRALSGVGIKGSGPWRVLIPGYLMHALDKGRDRLPYAPTASDAAYP